jgi:hypothetical protein
MLSARVRGGGSAASIVLTMLLATAGCGRAASTDTASGGGGGSSPEAATSEDGGGGGAAAPGTDLTACELVTADDVAAALGLDAGSVANGDLHQLDSDVDPNVTECRWAAQDWGGLSVIVSPGSGADQFAHTKESVADRAESLDIGDGALWVDDLGRGYFLKGSVLILVQFTYLADKSPFREPSISLGTAAVDKI